MIDLTPVFQGLVGILFTLIVVRLLPWIQSKTTEQQQRTLALVVDTLVHAAEQIYGPGGGKEKLEYVCGKLREKGFEVDIDAIEAAVMRMNDVPVSVVYQAGIPPDEAEG